jgi:hypothetical protein
MLKLNFLSEEAKKEAKFKRLHSLIARVDAVLLIGVIFLSVLFTSAENLMAKNFKEFYEQDTILKTSGQEYNEKIKKINEKLKTVAKIQKDFIPFSLIIKELTNRIPEGNSLFYIKADVNSRLLKISGQAKRREDFLNLKTKLSESPLFIEINSPLQNILNKENIDFEISIKLDLENFLNSQEK